MNAIAAESKDQVAPNASLLVSVPQIVLRKTEIVVPAFNVGKFLCSVNADAAAYISATEKPRVRINFYDSIKACNKAGTPLITNLQYLAMAQDVYQQPENWTGDKVGKGKLFQGLQDWSVSEAQFNDYESSDPTQRRWFALSNGQRVYDVAGHLFSWCRADVEGDPETGLINRAFAANSPSLITSPHKSMVKGVGWIPSAGSNWSGSALVRGGCFDSVDGAGVFYLGSVFPELGYGYVGVRCTN